MNKCRVWVDFLLRLTKGKATFPEAVGLHSHLLECDLCSERYNEWVKRTGGARFP